MRPEPKHVVGVVGNDIVSDSRVKKVAAAAAAAGYRSTILCYTTESTGSETRMGEVEVIRQPVPFVAHAKNGRVGGPLRPLNGSELAARHAGPRVYQLARKQRWEAQRSLDSSVRTRIHLLIARVALRVRQDAFRARRKGHVTADKAIRKWNLWRRRLSLRVLGPLRDGVPNIADYETTFVPRLVELEPDLIHAHDFHMIGVAVTAARMLRRRGHAVKVVYDAHELIEGLDYPSRMVRGWMKLEQRFIDGADAVTGISPDQLDLIADRYQLESLPTLVMNAPVVETELAGGTDIRSDIGASGPILLYHGNVTPERGLSTLVDALEYLPTDAHVAVMAPVDNPHVTAAEARAEAMGAANRFHVRPFVKSEALLQYISGADIAVVPYLSTGNTQIALPNKLFEAVQAGLPVLASDMRSITSFIRSRALGEIFRAGDSEDLASKATLILNDLDSYEVSAAIKAELSWDRQAKRLLELYASLLGEEVPDAVHIGIHDVTEAETATSDPLRTRLAVGPRNMAGQAFLISTAIQANLGVPSTSYSMERPGVFAFPVHQQITPEQWHDPVWQAHHREMLSLNFSHVLAESGTGMLGALQGGFIDDQLDMLREDGLSVAVLLHGSEIRDPDRHRLLPYSPYAVDDDLTRSLRRANARLRKHLENVDVPVFVTTPDLLEDIDAQWMPVVVDMATWGELSPPRPKAIPTILHLPSNTRLKGSDWVDGVVFDLEKRGLVRYSRPTGRLASDQVRALVEDADIVIDQLTIGAYGVMSCQAMAAERVTVANTRDIGFLKADCPIVDADPGNLDAILADLLARREDWPSIGRLGHAYVLKYHDGQHTAHALQSFLDQT